MSLLCKTVLVLNKYYLAMHVITAKDAILALYSNKAQVVTDDYEHFSFYKWVEFSNKNLHLSNKYEGIIHSPSVSFFIPQVIRMQDTDYTTTLLKTIKYSRKNVFQRDHYTCQYCLNLRYEILNIKHKDKMLTLDHIIPKSKGGPNTWENIVTACKWCNTEKGDKLLEDLKWTLYNNPSKPRWKSHVGVPFDKIKKDYWNKFLQ